MPTVAFELGVILPNFGEGATADGVARVAEAAEELGFDSVWTTEHFLVGPEAAGRFGWTLDSLSLLAWLAGRTERVRLGTSIVILPLHNPVRLAKETATIQELSTGRLVLGVGVGWHEDEFGFLGVEFRGRGRRADEAIRLLRALWRGDRSFEGRHWSFADASFAPLPDPEPEIWVGGSSERALRRALETGDAWHPTRSTADEVVRVKERHPELRVVPRIRVGDLGAMRAAGADGAVISFGTKPEQIVDAMHRVSR